MKKSIALVVVGIVVLIACIGDSEAFIGAVVIAAICFFMAYRSFKKFKHSQQVLQETQAAVEHLDIDQLAPIVYDDLAPKEGEEVYLAVPAQTYTSKERVKGYEGGHSGVSFRVAKGVTLRTGSQKAKAVKETVRTTHKGEYVVTNKRLIFVALQNGFEIPLEKVTAVKQISADSIGIVSGGTTKQLTMRDSDALYAHALTNAIIKKYMK